MKVERLDTFCSDINVYDTAISPILRSSIAHYESDQYRFCLRDEKSQIIGLLCVRKRERGWFIGPFYADSAKIAERLLIHACGSVNALECDEIHMSIPVGNECGLDLIEQYFHVDHAEQVEWRLNAPYEQLEVHLQFSIQKINFSNFSSISGASTPC